MDDAELVKRLRDNAKFEREEEKRAIAICYKAEHQDAAKECDEAASRIEILSAVIARVEALRDDAVYIWKNNDELRSVVSADKLRAALSRERRQQQT